MTTPDPYTPGTPEPGATPAGGVEPQPPAAGQPAPGQQYPAAPQAPGQAYPAPPAGQYAPAYGQPQAENPGKTLGIVGLVLGFFGPLSIVGLILSIMGLTKSRKVGQSNGVAVAGIVVSSLVLLGTIIVGIVLGIGIAHIVETCGELGPGTHFVDGITYTCS